MIIQHWKLKITESVTDAAHCEFQVIDEYHIPDLNMSMNYRAAFITREGRYAKASLISEKEVNDFDTIDALKQLVMSVKYIEENRTKTLETVKKLFEPKITKEEAAAVVGKMLKDKSFVNSFKKSMTELKNGNVIPLNDEEDP